MNHLRKIKFRNKRVFVRVDFNVPNYDMHAPRIIRTLPTIRFLLRQGAKVILATHAESNDKKIPSTRELAKKLKSKYFGSLIFSPELFGGKTEKLVANLRPGGMVFLENLRIDPGEKKCDKKFARNLSKLADFYINEAFSVSHRSHASIVLMPKLLPSSMGMLFENEVKNISRAFRPKKPFLFILGGGKTETKLPLLYALSKTADQVLLGGIIANDFLTGKVKPSRNFVLKKIILPHDVVIETSDGKKVMPSNEINSSMRIYDVGPESLKEWANIVKMSRFVVWNGPLGFMEKGYIEGTKKLVSILKKSKAEIIIGGGDTADFLEGKFPKNVFISTGGGAMLDFLSNKTLPGIEALKRK
ncbi:phosphoglycerate kinase [Candidatus Giovannonibacteria bacterium]|nr:phosphoglycerate kinase [Candidatus Giovannonibacteria bacterium]